MPLSFTEKSFVDQGEFHFSIFYWAWESRLGIGLVNAFGEGLLFAVPDVPAKYRGTTRKLWPSNDCKH